MELELGKPCPWCGEGSMICDGGAVGYYCDRGLKCKQPSPWELIDPARDAMAKFKAPKHLRKGQALFVFMAWLAEHKKVQYLRVDRDGNQWTLADTFYIPDHQLAKWWVEWVMSVEENHGK